MANPQTFVSSGLDNVILWFVEFFFVKLLQKWFISRKSGIANFMHNFLKEKQQDRRNNL
jgi:hypothetical protein